MIRERVLAGLVWAKPVAFPPGRDRLLTKPEPTGCHADSITQGRDAQRPELAVGLRYAKARITALQHGRLLHLD
jgi:hypothetical protein